MESMAPNSGMHLHIQINLKRRQEKGKNNGKWRLVISLHVRLLLATTCIARSELDGLEAGWWPLAPGGHCGKREGW